MNIGTIYTIMYISIIVYVSYSFTVYMKILTVIDQAILVV